jgi:hypothetical protein
MRWQALVKKAGHMTPDPNYKIVASRSVDNLRVHGGMEGKWTEANIPSGQSLADALVALRESCKDIILERVENALVTWGNIEE